MKLNNKKKILEIIRGSFFIYKKPQRLNIKKILLNCNRISWVTTAYTKRKGDFLRCLKQR